MRHLPIKTRIGSEVNHYFMKVRFSGGGGGGGGGWGGGGGAAFEPEIGSKTKRAEIDQITERIHSEE